MMKQYIVTGMSCAACQAHVEKAVRAVTGVTSCTVSLLTNSMRVEGDAAPEAVILAVQKAGYDAQLKDGTRTRSSASDQLQAEEAALEDRETPVLKRRLITSIGFLLVLMYISMGYNMWGWPVPSFLDHNMMALALTQLLLASAVMIINGKFFTSGFKSLFGGDPNMDTLVALGSSVSFGWSVYVMYRMTGVMSDMASMMELYHNELYFESAAMIPTLITVGKMLEARSKGKTTSALKGLMKLSPKTAVLIKDGKEVTVDIDEVQVGDLFAVRPGESIPVDGIIVEGSSSINESMLTGESIPRDVKAEDHVSAATINTTGYLRCRAERIGEDTALAEIINMVSDAAATKAPIAKAADQVSAIFVPAVMIIAAVTTVGWLLAGQTAAYALERGLSVLVISCPCALGLATPVAIMVGNGRGANAGILFKTSEALENTGRTEIVALDKTGTITSGVPEVTDIIPSSGITEQQLIQKAASLESRSEHPLAKAVMKKAKEEGITAEEVTDFEAMPGSGLLAILNGRRISGGSRTSMEQQIKMDEAILKRSDELASSGKTPLFFAENGTLLGIIAVADAIREDSRKAIQQLKQQGIEVVMITGDAKRTAEAIARQAGVDEVIAGVLPQGKQQVIELLKQRGRTAMVGDGINDAPALTAADVGIAIGAGTDVAIDAADVVLMKSRLSDVPSAIRLSRAVLKNIHENLFWAFFYNIICIPLAAGLYAWKLNPMIAAAAMSLSSVTVVSNALRLNLFHLEDAGKDRPSKHHARPATKAEKDQLNALMNPVCPISSASEKETVLIQCMMCEHCEAAISKALMKIDGITSVKADHANGTAVIEVTHPVSEADLKKAVEAAGYEYAGIGRKEEMNMEKTLKIEGMMCGHCEANVKKALEKIDGVVSATADHEAGTAVVTLNKEVDNAVLKKAVEDEDYKVTAID
jgi:Cu2+-exporting ATPase